VSTTEPNRYSRNEQGGIAMLTVLLLIATLLEPSTRPVGVPRPGYPGFALDRIIDRTDWDKLPKVNGLIRPANRAQMEAGEVAQIYAADKDGPVYLGEFHRGEALPEPYEDWRVVDFRAFNHESVHMVVTNSRTLETLRLYRQGPIMRAPEPTTRSAHGR
jgi:hypothetical protein